MYCIADHNGNHLVPNVMWLPIDIRRYIGVLAESSALVEIEATKKKDRPFSGYPEIYARKTRIDKCPAMPFPSNRDVWKSKFHTGAALLLLCKGFIYGSFFSNKAELNRQKGYVSFLDCIFERIYARYGGGGLLMTSPERDRFEFAVQNVVMHILRRPRANDDEKMLLSEYRNSIASYTIKHDNVELLKWATEEFGACALHTGLPECCLSKLPAKPIDLFFQTYFFVSLYYRAESIVEYLVENLDSWVNCKVCAIHSVKPIFFSSKITEFVIENLLDETMKSVAQGGSPYIFSLIMQVVFGTNPTGGPITNDRRTLHRLFWKELLKKVEPQMRIRCHGDFAVPILYSKCYIKVTWTEAIKWSSTALIRFIYDAYINSCHGTVLGFGDSLIFRGDPSFGDPLDMLLCLRDLNYDAWKKSMKATVASFPLGLSLFATKKLCSIFRMLFEEDKLFDECPFEAVRLLVEDKRFEEVKLLVPYVKQLQQPPYSAFTTTEASFDGENQNWKDAVEAGLVEEYVSLVRKKCLVPAQCIIHTLLQKYQRVDLVEELHRATLPYWLTMTTIRSLADSEKFDTIQSLLEKGLAVCDRQIMEKALYSGHVDFTVWFAKQYGWTKDKNYCKELVAKIKRLKRDHICRRKCLEYRKSVPGECPFNSGMAKMLDFFSNSIKEEPEKKISKRAPATEPVKATKRQTETNRNNKRMKISKTNIVSAIFSHDEDDDDEEEEQNE